MKISAYLQPMVHKFIVAHKARESDEFINTIKKRSVKMWEVAS